MNQSPLASDKTSRRAFTKSMVTTLVSAPIAISMISCGNGAGTGPQTATTNTPTPGGSPAPSPTPTPTPTTGGCTMTSCAFPATPEEHIPPMELDGAGSLRVDLSNKLKKTGSGPFTYIEDDGAIDPDDKFGDIKQARIITEIDTAPWITDVAYSGFLPGTELLLWYQDISPTPVDPNDTTYPPVTFPDNDPFIRIVGGKGPNRFKMVIKKKALSPDLSRKAHRPFRYMHKDSLGLARHFRIGKWRFVKDGQMLCEHSGAENYRILLFFGDYQP